MADQPQIIDTDNGIHRILIALYKQLQYHAYFRLDGITTIQNPRISVHKFKILSQKYGCLVEVIKGIHQHHLYSLLKLPIFLLHVDNKQYNNVL